MVVEGAMCLGEERENNLLEIGKEERDREREGQRVVKQRSNMELEMTTC